MGTSYEEDCPNGVKGARPDPKKASKVKTVKGAEKQEPAEKVTTELTKLEEPRTGSGSPPTSTKSKVEEVVQGRDATAELLSEATSLLKTLRSMKMLRLKDLKPQMTQQGGAVGLLDGGATNGLREARPREVPWLLPVKVELASGSTTLFRVKEHNTLLRREKVEVIVPLHRLVTLGYKLHWTSAGVKITHPHTLRGGCPCSWKGRPLVCWTSWRRGTGGN